MNFIDDKEKMNDLFKLPKNEFLKSYSYLTEEEYSETMSQFVKGKIDELIQSGSEMYEDVNLDTMCFIIQNEKDPRDIYVLVGDSNYDNDYLINIFYPEKSESTPEWDFSYNDYLYERLADKYEIVWIEENVHPVLWEDITVGYDEEDVKEDKGMQKYLEFCINNNITHDKVNSESFRCDDALKLYVGVEDKDYTTISFLNECEEMAKHNIACYSDGYLISKPKKNYEKQWRMENQKLRIIEKLLNQERDKLKEKNSFER